MRRFRTLSNCLLDFSFDHSLSLYEVTLLIEIHQMITFKNGNNVVLGEDLLWDLRHTSNKKGVMISSLKNLNKKGFIDIVNKGRERVDDWSIIKTKKCIELVSELLNNIDKNKRISDTDRDYRNVIENSSKQDKKWIINRKLFYSLFIPCSINNRTRRFYSLINALHFQNLVKRDTTVLKKLLSDMYKIKDVNALASRLINNYVVREIKKG